MTNAPVTKADACSNIVYVIWHNHWLGLIISFCFAGGAEGRWFPRSSGDTTARGSSVVEQETEVSDMIIPECQYKMEKQEKVPAELENEGLWPHQTCGSISTC